MTYANEDNVNRLFLDDLSVGQRFTSKTYAVGKSEMVAFASQFDPQPFHLDDRAAKGTIFGGLAASGWYTAAVTMRLQVCSGLPLAGGIVGAGGEISWPQPTRPGDVLRVESEVLDIRPSRSHPERGMVTLRSETRNQRNEVVQLLIVKVVVPRLANAEEPSGKNERRNQP
jgi:acyl dehydratase